MAAENKGSAGVSPKFEPGWVWLVGAGPGDPGLLTLHALHALQTADVIIYDALVSDEVMAVVPESAVKIFAGKRGGRPSAKQVDISETMIAKAKKGLRVARLKGGDPFTFGRGGEEALALVEAGVPFRVVPGVTSGVGGLAYAGIPATHRDIGHAISFVTGHMAGGDVPDALDWAGLAKSSPTIVLYMSMRHMDQIAKLLMEGGRPKDDPVAVISRATTKDQHILDTTLETCVDDIAKADLQPPSLIVIGEVVRLREKLDWFESLT